MLGKFLVVLTGLLAMSSTLVQGADVGDNLIHGDTHAQGEDMQVEAFPDRAFGRRWLMTSGAALSIAVLHGVCGTC